MIGLHNLRAPAGSTSAKKRRGTGMGSGLGKTAARGYKGQKSRSGARTRRGFEGGQMPLHRRLPKRGFTNIFKKEYAIVNLDRLSKIAEGTLVNPEFLVKHGFVKNPMDGIKILGKGELKYPLTVAAHFFSESAKEKITKVGGKYEVLQ
jgi:large subunit ribosomal protein L15